MERLRVLGRRWRWLDAALDVQERFGAVNGSYLAGSVTLTAFLSLFPLMLVIIATVGFFAHGSADVASDIINELGLTGTAAEALNTAIRQAEQSRRTASVVGFIGLLWSGLGLVAAIQYAFDSAWQVRGRGIRDKLVGLAWLAGAGVLFLAGFVATAALNFLPGFLAPLGILLGLAVNVVLFLWTAKVLPNVDVGWRPLLPGAILGAVGLEALKIVGSIYVPAAVEGSSALYGSIGTVFAVLAWLFLFGRLLVYAAVLNVVLWERGHGTVTVDLRVPRLPGRVPLEANRSGGVEEEVTPSRA
jgi:membrane protein